MIPLIYEQIVSLLGLIGLWIIWYYFWKPQRIDAFRQKLFALRSDLFDLAANGTVPFDHPAYTQLRLLINGMIRFAHRANFAVLLLAAAESQSAPSEALRAWQNSVQELPENTRKQLLDVHASIFELFAKHIIGGSIALWTYIVFRVALSITRDCFLFLVGKKGLANFTVDRVRMKVDRDGSQATKAGVQVIEARVLFEEQRRTGVKTQHAFAQ
jgi:hypothetical protein